MTYNEKTYVLGYIVKKSFKYRNPLINNSKIKMSLKILKLPLSLQISI